MIKERHSNHDSTSADTQPPAFETINSGFNTVFKPHHLSIGLAAPIENNAQNPVPSMEGHLQRVKLAESLGFKALWLRDIPFNVPSFGDAGQLFDPFVYLGFLAAHTTTIALGVGSLILPLRHPAHVAKAAASVDSLSGGRLILGIASGDRPEEYPALNQSFDDRGRRFRDSVDYIRHMAQDAPHFKSMQGNVGGGIDMLPKPASSRLPLLVTGGSQQTPAWVAQHGDGWMTYPRNTEQQARVIQQFQSEVTKAGLAPKPVMQSLYIDIASDPHTPPQPIHLGFRSGVHALRDYLKSLESVGVNHVALNLRFNQAEIDTSLQLLANDLLPDFS